MIIVVFKSLPIIVGIHVNAGVPSNSFLLFPLSLSIVFGLLCHKEGECLKNQCNLRLGNQVTNVL